MDSLIDRVAEPRRLFLAWQAPDSTGERFRWAVAVLERSDGEHPGIRLRYLPPGAEFERYNPGRSFDDLVGLGYRGYPAFDLKQRVHGRGVIEAFLRRIPARSRPDFPEYMKQFLLDPKIDISDLALLGRTEAKLPGDGFSLVDPLDPSDQCCDLLLEVAGHRYYVNADSLSLERGDPVHIEDEPNNPKDPNAVQLVARQRKIGNINRLQAPAFLRWLAEAQVSGEIARLNGRPDKPRAFVFVSIRPKGGGMLRFSTVQ